MTASLGALRAFLGVVSVVFRIFEHRALRQAGADALMAEWLEKESKRVEKARKAADRAVAHFDNGGGVFGDDPFARD